MYQKVLSKSLVLNLSKWVRILCIFFGPVFSSPASLLSRAFGLCNLQHGSADRAKLNGVEHCADVAKDATQDSFVEKLIANVIKNLEVTVTNIHVRFEDNVTNSKKPFSVGVTLRELSLRVRMISMVYYSPRSEDV